MLQKMKLKSQTPHFFKVILQDDIGQRKQLVIPTKFVRTYAEYLKGEVFLKAPSGSTWQFELVRTGGTVYFGNGWQQFADYYSISHGSFLVFGFDDLKRCSFSVMIFDKTASEIDYPANESPENTEDKSELPYSRPCKKMKHKSQTLENKQRRQSTYSETINNIRDFEKFTTFNPYFKLSLTSSYLEHNHLMVPRFFVEKCKNRNIQKVILQVGDQVWSVKLLSYPERATYRFSAGISRFFNDNDLEVGDVCVFELINSETMLLKVSIFRKNCAM